MGWLFIPLVLAICAAILAGNKNRSGAGWFFITLLFCPAILILLCLNTTTDAICPGCKGEIWSTDKTCTHCGKVFKQAGEELPQETGATEPQKETRECPFCAEDILLKAIVCKHCGRDVEPIDTQPANEATAGPKEEPSL